MNYPPLPYSITPRAEAKIQAQRRYLNGKAPGKGEEFYEKILIALDWISENYHVPPDAPDHPGMKRLVLKNKWAIVYEVGTTEVTIASLLHPGQGIL